MRDRDANTLDRVPSRDTPPDWLTTSPKTAQEVAFESVAIQAIEREGDELHRFTDLLSAGVWLLDRLPPGTVLYADGRIELPQ